jgi:hypothetical protein
MRRGQRPGADGPSGRSARGQGNEAGRQPRDRAAGPARSGGRDRAAWQDRAPSGERPRNSDRARSGDRTWNSDRTRSDDRSRNTNETRNTDGTRNTDRTRNTDGARSNDRTRSSDRTWNSDRSRGGGRERPGGERPRTRRDDAPFRRDQAPAREAYVPGPQVPESVSAQQLDPEARAQLNSLPNDLADSVARYLVAAGLAEDAEQGYAYAQAAKRLAARVGVVREACGITAYRTGRWAEALSELRAARRMTGRDDYLPIMADCERALGRLDRALALVREASTADLDRATQIELRIVESGIRRDQGLPEAAVLALQVPELTSSRLRPWSVRLFYAYADALLAAGRADEARDAFARAAGADTDGETDAADRLDELDGIEWDDLEDDNVAGDDAEGDPGDDDPEGDPEAQHPTASQPG